MKKPFKSAIRNLQSAFAISALFLVAAFAQDTPRDPIAEFPSRVKRITLENGLRALIIERPDSPTVSFAAYIRTGGIDDDMGRSGLAHMFEHMLFKGTKTIGTKDYAKEAPLLDKIDVAAIALQAEQDKGSKADAEKLKALSAKLDDLQ